MKTIGIKLADGTFYPILQENTASEKKLDLTTAHNNQTKVMVDLYRSANCTMDDAEYVDSLQIDNLIEHPNGEPDISFSVAIDEDNKLSAKIVDTETGNQSKTTITLVSRTQEERLNTDEYDISDSKEKDSKKKMAGAAAGGGLLAAAMALREKELNQKEEAVSEDDFTLGDPAASTEVEFVPAGNFEDVPADETVPEEPIIEEPAVTEEPVIEDNIVVEDAPVTEESSVDLDLPDFEMPVEPAADETIVTEEPVVEEPVIEEPVAAEPSADEIITDDLPDFDMPVEPAADETIVAEEPAFAEESVVEEPAVTENTDLDLPDFDIPADETISDSSTDLPDIDFDFPGDDTAKYTSGAVEDEPVTETNTDDAFNDDAFNIEDSGNFDLPDIEDNSASEEDVKLDDSFFDMDDNQENSTSTNTNDDIPASSGGISFTGLYDKETELGESSSTEQNEVQKKTKAPVIICIICAIICIIATLLVLFIVPSKYNLLNKKTEKAEEVVPPVEKVVEAPAPVVEPEPEVIEEPEPEPVPEAKEDEVVVIEKAEEVVPEQPPVAEEKPKDITYKIKWGDTLWDISDTYYKNPWRYKYIARYNGIKNPDYIISGTYITIPAE